MNTFTGLSPDPAARGPPEPASTTQHGNSQKTSSASSTSAAAATAAVFPLAPLEFLQNQRRGSITDPSLHAARPSNPSLPPLQISAQSRPSPAFSPESNILPHIRSFLRSPSPDSVEEYTGHRDAPRDERSRGAVILIPSVVPGADGHTAPFQDTRMEVDEQHPPYETQDRASPESSEVNGRRASFAGMKRKMSPDRGSATPGDIDPQLVGHSVSNEPESEEPAQKRRSLVLDATRLGHLSINDRRNSLEGRTGGGQQWWSNEAREQPQPPPSGAGNVNPGLANTPMTGYSTPSSGMPGDSPHGHPPAGINATFAWPANTQADPVHVHPPGQNEANASMANNNPPYDPLAMMPQQPFSSDRRLSQDNMSTPSSAGPTRSRTTRSRPSSRNRRAEEGSASTSGNVMQDDGASTSQLQSLSGKDSGGTPYSRSPELRVSHKLAERKRRKEMKDLFDELRDQLPADRGMKASKWEILSKAIDFIATLKQSHGEMSREIDMLRHEVESVRQGIPPFPPGGAPPMYHPPPVGVQPFPPPPPGAAPNAHPVGPHPGPPQQPPQPPHSRPDSSQNAYPPAAGQSAPPPQANGNGNGDAARTDPPS
ncbi:hypothetical protein EUX98_g613 [Antrodiella citrinella]|uniref:BHLH domain-containing protein n=1 Tax=Antrodiella citrinella TaxID=2447956 RepID=A0A4S4N664_9APHY|nr:hypothetical protein EUX98_g613 [Antrodiella citrinella]